MERILVTFAVLYNLFLISNGMDLVTRLEMQASHPVDSSSAYAELSSVSGHESNITAKDSGLQSIPVNNGISANLNTTCSDTWFLPKTSSNGSTSCECGSDLRGID